MPPAKPSKEYVEWLENVSLPRFVEYVARAQEVAAREMASKEYAERLKNRYFHPVDEFAKQAQETLIRLRAEIENLKKAQAEDRQQRDYGAV
jgi:hypothetical protein